MTKKTEVMRYLDEDGDLVVGFTFVEEGVKMAEITRIEYTGENDGSIILDTTEIAEELLLRMVDAIRGTGVVESVVEGKGGSVPLSELKVGDEVMLVSPGGFKTQTTITEVLPGMVRDGLTGETGQADINHGWRIVRGWDA